ncbi:FKBP-type peptidyl-prolyl cis-trans isomerase [Changpingibacter yushuensis]|uniref:FKBP-type peptidyl-prolyl cis-trans isomerase n=1 Tax=Changpingibacter yushuensis TaxID=2758440 RepID=UPI0015F6DF5A|nr:FKBP-type peptidyl-prolyl cis-trans isomerase [Changpingibacter yushuensis]
MRNRLLASALAAGLLFSVAACSSGDALESESSASASSSASSIPAPDVKFTSDGMPTLASDSDGNPSLEFPDSDAPADLTVDILEEGDGDEVSSSDFVVVDYAGFVWGGTEAFDSSFANGSAAAFYLSNLVTGWQYGLDGTHVGDKLIISIPADYGYGPSGGNESAGISETDTIAFYIEIHDRMDATSAGQADASVEVTSDDLPLSYVGDLGAPITEVTINDGEAEPTEVSSTIIAKGSGDEVGSDGTMVIAYAASTWDGSTVENTWTGEPSDSILGPQAVTVGYGTIFDALIGTPVGSRVLILMPATDGDDSTSATAAYGIVADVLEYLPASSTSDGATDDSTE